MVRIPKPHDSPISRDAARFRGLANAGLALLGLGARIRGTLGHIDPLNKVPFKESQK